MAHCQLGELRTAYFIPSILPDAVRSTPKGRREVDKKRSQVAVAPPVDVLGCSRGSRNPFILAARTEAEMLARFHWSTVGLSAAAFVVGVTVLWMLSVR